MLNNFINALSKANFNQMFISCYGTLIPFSKIFNNKNICIVGNAPTLLGKNKGSVIDSYKTIIRFTDFVTRGFEKDVGSKTHIWVTGGAKQTKLKKRLLPNNVKKIYLSPSQYTIPTMTQFVNKNLRMSPKGFIFYRDINFMRAITNNMKIYPSTGLATILFLVARFGKVDTIGFDFFRNGIHYYDNRYVLHKEHNWNKEYEIYSDLIRLNRVRNLLD